MKKAVIVLIDFYRQFLSFDRGLLSVFCPGGACRHNPTCSLYTKQAVKEHGVIRGLVMGGKRIITCK